MYMTATLNETCTLRQLACDQRQTEHDGYDCDVTSEPPTRPARQPDGGAPAPVTDERLLAAAARVLEDAGWQGLTVEAVAEAAGLSRVTAWRLGASREALVASLLAQLDQDYREAMWPAIVGAGSARLRLDRAITALFDVIDAHLPLLLASDTIFHRASTTRLSFNEPFMRLFSDGAVDGSVAQIAADPEEASDVLFNVICWPYAHLRGRHGWPPERARQRLRGIVAPSLDPSPSG
jgi:AcrR family transcriptional regulator